MATGAGGEAGGVGRVLTQAAVAAFVLASPTGLVLLLPPELMLVAAVLAAELVLPTLLRRLLLFV